MQKAKLDKIVMHVEKVFSNNKKKPRMNENVDHSLIKKAQNLIKNGPKNVPTQNSENSFYSKKSALPTPPLKPDKNENKSFNILNKSLNKSQDTNVLSIVTKNSKNTNQIPSPGLSQSRILKDDSQLTINQSYENKFGQLENLETKKIITTKPKLKSTNTVKSPRRTPPTKKISGSTKTVSQTTKKPTPTKKETTPPKTKNTASISQEKLKKYQATLDRFEVYNQLKSRKLNDLKLKYHNEDLSNASFNSFLSKNSSRYLKDKEYTPPHKKVNEVLSKKKQSINNIKEKISKEKAIKEPEPSFHPVISEKGTDRRTKEEFYTQMMDWAKKKKENQVLKELEFRQFQSTELTFHPNINYNSRGIMNDLDGGTGIQDRLVRWQKKLEEKKKNILKSLTPDFKPKISKTSISLAQAYREKMLQKQEQAQLEKDDNNSTESPKKNPSVSFNLDNNIMEEIERQYPEEVNDVIPKENSQISEGLTQEMDKRMSVDTKEENDVL